MALVRRYVRAEQWTPTGIEKLEPNALTVVRARNNRSVIAGPGSGKTELLAQRASYLLQCSVCVIPRRILAISYKRDAAHNIAQRVSARCHPEQAHRFDSLTFDAFAKSLLDRFGQALPQAWRPTPDYEIAYARDPAVRAFLDSLSPPASVGTEADIIALGVKNFEKRWVVARPLPDRFGSPASAGAWAKQQFWASWLRGDTKSFLTFAMIGRLAELLVRTNPMVRQALRLTYSHVFMDEFQDTTQVQYDLVKGIFLGSETIVTAVGDNKQQIMRWAMAMDDPFASYEVDFRAERTPLKHNYRSSPDLVRIQDILARALDSKAITPVSQSKGTVVGPSCEVWDFKTPATEAARLAAFVNAQMQKYGLKPRDFAVLVRLRADNYMKTLEPGFSRLGLNLRNEALLIGDVALQELLIETASDVLTVLLRLATAARAGRYWTDSLEMLCYMRGLALDDEIGRARVARELDLFATTFAKKHPTPPTSLAQATAIVTACLDFVGRASLLTVSPAYRQGDWLQKVTEAATQHLQASGSKTQAWTDALDAYEGTDTVPLMTIHKSKGLEYHTVLFVGLDDDAWFNFHKESTEEKCGFFVAFSRAKQRVIFSYCAARGGRTRVAPLYELLSSAGVRTRSVDKA
jgi:superfamily I DNA/RNA helicase